MQKGDYRKSNGMIVQIANIHSTYTDVDGNVLNNSIDIAVTDAVLLTCGFIYDKECSTSVFLLMRLVNIIVLATIWKALNWGLANLFLITRICLLTNYIIYCILLQKRKFQN